jgi:hypothetical protein
MAATESRAAGTPSAAPADATLAEKIREANAECYACHSEAGFRTPPRPDLDLAKLKRLLHDPEPFDASIHAGMACTICHGQSAKTFPHAANIRESISQCSECHAQKAMRVEGQFDDSVHAIRLKDKFTCQTCHDPHVYRVAQKLGEPRKIVAQDNAMCIDCHNSDLRFSAFVENLTPRKARPDLDALHAWLPNTQLHWRAVRCIECHTPVSKVKSLAMSHEVLPKEKAERNCVACHSQDTALRVRLYRFAQETKLAEYGFVNSAILDNAYVVGATRNPALDRIVIGLFALTVLALLGHGAVRLVAAVVRRRKPS